MRFLLAVALLLAACTSANPLCFKDTDCAPGRICNADGRCEGQASYDLRPDFTGSVCGCVNVNDCLGTKIPTDCFDGVCRPYYYTCYIRDAGAAPDGDSCPGDGVHYSVREPTDGGCGR